MMTKAILSQITKFLDEKCENLEKIAVGVSGGPDSMCLTYCVNDWCKSRNIELHAIIIDHSLRLDSAEEANEVLTFLLRQQIKTSVIKWHGDKPKSGVQNAARNARYSMFVEYCKLHQIKHLVLGHNKDDNAETFLMRALRGSSINGMASINCYRDYKGIVILRPMLQIKRDDIEWFLRSVSWPYVTDPSNCNGPYNRTKIRSVIKMMAGQYLGDIDVVSALSLAAENASRANNFIEKCVEKSLNEFVIFQKNEIILQNTIYSLDDELLFRVFAKLAHYLTGKSIKFAKLSKIAVILREKRIYTHKLHNICIQKDVAHTIMRLHIAIL